MGLGCDRNWSKKVSEIQRILKSQVSASLNSITVLRTMVEWQVEPLKQRAHLLCDYARIKNFSHEVMEMLEAGEVMKWITGLVTSVIVVVFRNTVEAFLANYRPDLVSPLFILCLPFTRGR